MSKIVIRDLRPEEDLNFIYTTWLRGLFNGNDYYTDIFWQIFFDNHRHKVEHVLTRPKIEVRMAVLEDAPDVIVGYSVLESEILHWIFIKPVFRKLGIFKDLVTINQIKFAANVTNSMRPILRAHKIIVNPYLGDKNA